MKEIVFKSPYDEEKLRKMMAYRCKKRTMLSLYQQGIFYQDTHNGFYLEKVNNTLIRSVFKRILKCRIVKDGDKTLLKCRFVFRKAAKINIAIIVMMLLLSGAGLASLIVSFSKDMLLGAGIVFAISITMAMFIYCGKWMFAKEETEAIEFLQERITNNLKEE